MTPGQPETEVAVLTARGPGAIASCLVAGPAARELVNHCFRPTRGRPLAADDTGRVLHGCWQTGEELIVCQQHEGQIAVHCHGGEAAIETVLAALCEAGGRPVAADQLLARLAPHRLAHTLSELLLLAPTQRVAGLLLEQSSGLLADSLGQIVEQLHTDQADQAALQLARLQAEGPLARHLVTPWRVCLVGVPNVGKSSLLNVLAGYQRAIVDEQSGTTRDRLSALTALDGWPVELIDTAGFDDSQQPLERAGRERARQALESADLVLMVEDARQPGSGTGTEAVSQRPTLIVRNKWDLLEPAAMTCQPPAGNAADPGVLEVSATEEWGISRLISRIVGQLIPDPPVAGLPIPCGQSLADDLDQACQLIAEGNPAAAAELLSDWL